MYFPDNIQHIIMCTKADLYLVNTIFISFHNSTSDTWYINLLCEFVGGLGNSLF